MRLYSVYDRIAEGYANPMVMQNDGTALRSFRDEINRPNQESNLYMHADDYELWYIGEMNTKTGEITSIKELIVTGASCKERDNG